MAASISSGAIVLSVRRYDVQQQPTALGTVRVPVWEIQLHATPDLVSYIRQNIPDIPWKDPRKPMPATWSWQGAGPTEAAVVPSVSSLEILECVLEQYQGYSREPPQKEIGMLLSHILAFGCELICQAPTKDGYVNEYVFFQIPVPARAIAAVSELHMHPQLAVMSVGLCNDVTSFEAPEDLRAHVIKQAPWLSLALDLPCEPCAAVCVSGAGKRSQDKAHWSKRSLYLVLSSIDEFGYELMTTMDRAGEREYVFSNRRVVERHERGAQARAAATLETEIQSLKDKVNALQVEALTRESETRQGMQNLQEELRIQAEPVSRAINIASNAEAAVEARFTEAMASVADAHSHFDVERRSLEDSMQEMRVGVEALGERVGHAEGTIGDLSQNAVWPVIQVYDAGEDPTRERCIRVECPGVLEDDIDIERLPNGVRLGIRGVSDSDDRRKFVKAREAFTREFHFDHHAEGCFELMEDQCCFESGVILLVLKHLPVQRVKLRRAAEGPGNVVVQNKHEQQHQQQQQLQQQLQLLQQVEEQEQQQLFLSEQVHAPEQMQVPNMLHSPNAHTMDLPQGPAFAALQRRVSDTQSGKDHEVSKLPEEADGHTSESVDRSYAVRATIRSPPRSPRPNATRSPQTSSNWGHARKVLASPNVRAQMQENQG